MALVIAALTRGVILRGRQLGGYLPYLSLQTNRAQVKTGCAPSAGPHPVVHEVKVMCYGRQLSMPLA